jgi:hypothetical protein
MSLDSTDAELSRACRLPSLNAFYISTVVPSHTHDPAPRHTVIHAPSAAQGLPVTFRGEFGVFDQPS